MDTPNVSTAIVPRRIVYFKGHKDEPRSTMITQLCRDYETVTGLFHGESATRTIWNLYNLHVTRGCVNPVTEKLIFPTSMTGPHNYFGWIDPRKHYTIQFQLQGDRYPVFIERSPVSHSLLTPLPPEFVVRICDYEWLKGSTTSHDVLKSYAGAHGRGAASPAESLYTSLVDTSTGRPESDSLFDYPGILALETSSLVFPVVHISPHQFDLSPYHAQIVPNSSPFGFDQKLVESHPYAQLRLRVITYNYGDRYLPDYLMNGSGVFIERHEFIQSITPLSPSCGGFVLLGREIEEATAARGKCLELVACTVPFGFTLLVDVGAIHGDSTLTGEFMMAMTGNHTAMKTADTVFLKHRPTRCNVQLFTNPTLPCSVGHPGTAFCVTSEEQSLHGLRCRDADLKQRIMAGTGAVESVYWHPVVATKPAKALGFDKFRPEIPSEDQK